jgi:hypothetical protein
MASAPNTIQAINWENYQVSTEDLEFINNFLFELETPQTTEELLKAVILDRLAREKKQLADKQKQRGRIYIPAESYSVNESIQFPILGWKEGKVISTRPGLNPEIGTFDVMEVALSDDHETRSFAFNLNEHTLNTSSDSNEESDQTTLEIILEKYQDNLVEQLEDALATDPDLVLITGSWFPRALFVDINPGQLNLAEAVLDMAGGGPIDTKELIEQLDLPKDVNSTLTEFSLNLALEEDARFDEVGPSGDVLWYLERLEPENVRNTPSYLQYSPTDVDRSLFTPQMLELEKLLDDEYCSACNEKEKVSQTEVILTYPHWRAGTLPLTNRTKKLFPTALESPRIRFQFMDVDTKEKFQGWVVRPGKYIVGLSEWYKANGIIPGSLITIHKANASGDVMIRVEKKRVKEWLRTVLVGADGGIVYALLKQQVGTSYDERMATFTPDPASLDAVWEKQKRVPIEKVIIQTTNELTRLNPQGHVHAQELYAAVNVIKRCPPDIIFQTLLTSPSFSHVGDLYYRLADAGNEEGKSGK